MQILPEDKSSLAYAGAQLGQGLSNSFQNEFAQSRQAGRLSSALQQMQGQNLTPLQQAQNLIGARASDSQLAMLLPLLEREYQNQRGQKLAEAASKRQGLPENQFNKMQNAEIEQKIIDQKKPEYKKLITKDEELAFQNPIKRLSGDELLIETRKAFDSGNFRTWKDAEDYIVNKNLRDIENQSDLVKQYNQKKQILEDLQNLIEKRSGLNLENFSLPNLSEDTSGIFFQKVLDEAQQNLVDGDTLEQASKKASDKLRTVANNRTSLETGLSQANVAGGEKQALINQSRKIYAENDLLPVFVEDQVAGGLSYPTASQNAYPIENNKNIVSEINKVKLPIKQKNLAYDESANMFKEGIELKTRTLADKLASYITDSDSLLSIANYVREKDLDPVALMDEFKILNETGNLKLSDFQISELSKTASYRPSLKDRFIEWSKQK